MDRKLLQMFNKISARIMTTNYLNTAVGSELETFCTRGTTRSGVKKCTSIRKMDIVINCLHN